MRSSSRHAVRGRRDADLMIGAYRGSELVGCVMSIAQDYLLFGKVVPAAYGSWFSVDPSCAGTGVGRRIAESPSGGAPRARFPRPMTST